MDEERAAALRELAKKYRQRLFGNQGAKIIRTEAEFDAWDAEKEKCNKEFQALAEFKQWVNNSVDLRNWNLARVVVNQDLAVVSL